MIVCMNAATSGITEWDLDWFGVGAQDGVVYGLTSTALVSLDGDAEAGFSGSFRTGELDFGTHRDKRVLRAYFEVELGEDAAFTATPVSHGAADNDTYPLPVQVTDGTDSSAYRRLPLAKGPHAAWWAFGLSGVNWTLGWLGVRAEKQAREG